MTICSPIKVASEKCWRSWLTKSYKSKVSICCMTWPASRRLTSKILSTKSLSPDRSRLIACARLSNLALVSLGNTATSISIISICRRIRVIGVRNSWEACASNKLLALIRCSIFCAAWLKPRASRAISSLPRAFTRTLKSPSPSWLICWLIWLICQVIERAIHHRATDIINSSNSVPVNKFKAAVKTGFFGGRRDSYNKV